MSSSSYAVDFPKTGFMAEMPPEMQHNNRALSYPDFMQKDHKNSYVSTMIIGKMEVLAVTK